MSTIRALVLITKVSWLPHHVKGHQDSALPRRLLNWWALRNIECDARAKRYRRKLVRLGRTKAPNPRFFSEPSSLFIAGIKQSRLDPESIMEIFTLPKLLAYWETRHRLGSATLQEINWDRVAIMMRQLPSGLQRWVTKHAVGMCGVGKFKHRWNRSVPNQCPRCTQEEDHLHVTRCGSDSAQQEWDSRVSTFVTWMSSNRTAPEIIAVFSHLLRCIRNPAAIHQVGSRVGTRHPHLLLRAIRSQKAIGVQGMIEGLLSQHWDSEL